MREADLGRIALLASAAALFLGECYFYLISGLYARGDIGAFARSNVVSTVLATLVTVVFAFALLREKTMHLVVRLVAAFLISMLILLAVIQLLKLYLANFAELDATLNSYQFIGFGSIAVAYLTYLLRHFKRVIYGHLEIAFGAAAIILTAFHGKIPDLNSAALLHSDIRTTAIQFIAGMYIIVRGFSNLEDGLGVKPITPTIYVRSLMRNPRP